MPFVRSAALVALLLACFPRAVPAADYPANRFNLTLRPPGRAPQFGSFRLFERGGELFAELQGPVGSPTELPAEWDGEVVRLPWWDGGTLRGRWDGRRFAGLLEAESSIPIVGWSAVPAPDLGSRRADRWAEPVVLFDGSGAEAWFALPTRMGALKEATIRDDVLVVDGSDVVSRERFSDFELHLEYRLGPSEDSGVFLRGRYEIQLRTNPHDGAGERGVLGALYGWRAPDRLVGAEPEVFHTLDARLVGRRLWVRLDGVSVHDGVIVESITGDALDADEAQPGPIVLQGQYGHAEFRDIRVTPAR